MYVPIQLMEFKTLLPPPMYKVIDFYIFYRHITPNLSWQQEQ